MTILNARQLEDARARIKAKLDTDDAVVNAFNKANQYTYQQKKELANQIIDNMANEDIEAFLDNATYKEKGEAVQRVFDQFKQEREYDRKNKEKLKVDRDAEKARNAPINPRPDLSPAEKAAEVNDLLKFYRRQNKREDAERRQVDADVEAAFVDNKNVFNYIQRAAPANDIFSYRRAFNRYSGLNSTRSYVETSRRVRFNQPVVGSYFSFRYFAKNWQTLPKFDRSPLIYVLSVEGDRFLGINFHWCRTNNIAFELIDEIESGNTNINFPDECYHTYLIDQKYLKSQLYYIAPEEIRTALLLPLVMWFIK
jgi:hypothetical protein